MRRTHPSPALLLVLLALPAQALMCDLTAGGQHYDLTPLGGLHQASTKTDSPPTVYEARATFDICSEDGIPREDGVADEDQVCQIGNAYRTFLSAN